MKLSLVNRGPLSRVAARNCFIVNQFATPGLGSLMARRWIAGIGQLVVCVIGFILVVAWFFKTMAQYYGEIGGNVPTPPDAWIGETGAILFAAAWLWSLVTSISLMLQAKKDEIGTPKQNEPPKLS